MKQFRFNLSTLLKKRIQEEEELKKKLSLIENHVEEMKSIYESLKKEETLIEEEIRSFSSGTSKHELRQSAYQKLHATQKSLNQQKNSIRLANEELSKSLKKAIQARKRTELVENLYEEQKLAWQKKLQKDEQKFYDEVASNQFEMRRPAHDA